MELILSNIVQVMLEKWNINPHYFFLYCTVSILLIHSHIIHDHPLWKSSSAVGISGPVASNGYIQNEKERFVKRIISVYICFISGKVFLIINIPFNFCRIPYKAEHMEFL